MLLSYTLVKLFQGTRASNLILKTMTHSIDDADVPLTEEDMENVNLDDMSATLYNTILECEDSVFDGRDTDRDEEFKFSEERFTEIREGASSAVDDRATKNAMHTVEDERVAASKLAVQAFLRKNVFRFGIKRLRKCGGDLDCLARNQVSVEVAKKAEDSGMKAAFEQYAEPLTKRELDKRSLRETNPFGVDAKTVISLNGTPHNIESMSENMMFGFRQGAQQDLVHLHYQRRVATDTRVIRQIDARIQDIEIAFENGFGAAVDPTMKRRDLRDPDADRTGSMSAMNVSGCGSRLGRVAPLDGMLLTLREAGAHGDRWRNYLDLKDAISVEGQMIAYGISSNKGPVLSEEETTTPLSDGLAALKAGASILNIQQKQLATPPRTGRTS